MTADPTPGHPPAARMAATVLCSRFDRDEPFHDLANCVELLARYVNGDMDDDIMERPIPDDR